MADLLQQRFTEHLRQNSRWKCVLCGRSQFDQPTLGRHLESEHGKQTATTEGAAEIQQLVEQGRPQTNKPKPTEAPGPARTGATKRTSAETDAPEGNQPESAVTSPDKGPDWASTPGRDGIDDESDRLRKRVKSPTSSVQAQYTQGSPSTGSRTKAARAPVTSRAPAESSANPRNPKGRRIWEGTDLQPEQLSPPPPPPPRQRASRQGGGHGFGSARNASRFQEADEQEDPASVEHCIKQPQTKPISHEQLVAEVKGIYAGLVMVESKCIEVDNAQNAQNRAASKLTDEQWQALIALHRTLLHEHHDFFLASQHPSASAALRRLALKYAMPARMWRHGIHSFLELLRHRLPESREHMLSFIYLAYSIMALLFETVPAFEDVWIECLGDLGRYRMAIEDDDVRDREVWTAVSRRWYSRASDKSPSIGRLYHHLAILARPHAVQQLFFYTKGLTVAVPFPAARESILTLLDPLLGDANKVQTLEATFVEIHAILFTHREQERLPRAIKKYQTSLDDSIARTAKAYIEMGFWSAIVNCSGLLEYGAETNCLTKIIARAKKEADPDSSMSGAEDEPQPEPSDTFRQAQGFAVIADKIVLRRFGDPNCFGFTHVRLAWMFSMAETPKAMALLEADFPWKLLVLSLNFLMSDQKTFGRIESDEFPRPVKGEQRPLREDWAMRGYSWTDNYFPVDWFKNVSLDEEDKMFETPSMTEDRKERILWLGIRLAKFQNWFVYDSAMHRFNIVPKFDIDTELLVQRKDEKLGGLGHDDGLSSDFDTLMSSPPTTNYQ